MTGNRPDNSNLPDSSSLEQVETDRLLEQLADVRQQLLETKHKLDEMRTHALVDSLTGVGNRRALDQDLGRRLTELDRYQSPFAIMMLDIDLLKLINDRHGHPAGDRVIQATADLLRGSLRRSDLLYRIGGDEFVAILPGINANNARLTAERLCRQVAANRIDFDDRSLQTSISVGIAAGVKADTPETLLARVDKQLYRSKKAGGNRVSVKDE